MFNLVTLFTIKLYAGNDTAYIAWNCCPDGKHTCCDTSDKWSDLKAVINEHSNDQITVAFLSFEMQPHKTKKDCMKEKLTPVKRDANAEFTINFIDELLPAIIKHRNILQHYKNRKKGAV